MKKQISTPWRRKGSLLALFLLVWTGTLYAADYGQAENWVICDKDGLGSFDIFYVYPTLVAKKETPLMDWGDPKIVKKTKGFAEAQTRGIFQSDARIFAPFVRQLEYGRCLAALKDGIPAEQTEMKHGIQDTLDAFSWYMENCNGGRPFILLGHSQGSVDLYFLLKNRKDLSPEKGFAAAYLIGLSHITDEIFARDFANRAIVPAKKSDDIGVVIVWNTQSPEAENPLFTGQGTLCNNPLNWRTDGTPANPDENLGAVFYDYRTGKTERVPHFCGAAVDPAKGALIVDLPVRSQYDARGFMGSGVFHMNDIWFFAENLRFNAKTRIRTWHRKYGENPPKEQSPESPLTVFPSGKMPCPCNLTLPD